MQYGFYINQKAMVDLRELTGVKLDHSHAAIVNFIKDFAGTGELETRIIGDKSYYWLSYGKISEEMPLYDWEKDTIYRKMKQLVQAKILEHFYDDKEQKSYYAFGENYIYIVKPISVPIPRGSENNPKGVGLKSEGGSENNPYNHNTNTTSSEKIEKGESEVTCEYDVDNPTQPDFEAETDSVGTPALDFTQTWEPNPMYHQATQRACPDMTQPDFEAELIKFRLFYENDWPKHPDKTWLSWCQRANSEYRERTQRRIKSEQNSNLAQNLAQQRVRDFHEKKKQNIQKVGAKRSEVFKPYYRDYESREAYEQAILEARDKGLIVETDPLPSNACTYWGEVPLPEVQHLSKKMQIRDDDQVDIEKRKQELYQQAQSIK